MWWVKVFVRISVFLLLPTFKSSQRSLILSCCLTALTSWFYFLCKELEVEQLDTKLNRLNVTDHYLTHS